MKFKQILTFQVNLLAAYMAVSISVDSIAKSDPPHQDVLRKSVG